MVCAHQRYSQVIDIRIDLKQDNNGTSTEILTPKSRHEQKPINSYTNTHYRPMHKLLNILLGHQYVTLTTYCRKTQDLTQRNQQIPPPYKLVLAPLFRSLQRRFTTCPHQISLHHPLDLLHIYPSWRQQLYCKRTLYSSQIRIRNQRTATNLILATQIPPFWPWSLPQVDHMCLHHPTAFQWTPTLSPPFTQPTLPIPTQLLGHDSPRCMRVIWIGRRNHLLTETKYDHDILESYLRKDDPTHIRTLFALCQRLWISSANIQTH